MVKVFKDRLQDWTDWDVAAYSLSIALGLMPDEPAFGKAKCVFWTDHPVGNLLHKMLDELATHGVLEKRDEPDLQYRWNEAYRGSWPGKVFYCE